MCGLCSQNPDEAATARGACLDLAQRLQDFAAYQKRLASGSLKPHGEGMDHVRVKARALIRDLVAQWL